MKKKKLYTTSMATAVLVASIATPIASASSADEIANYYGSTESVKTTPVGAKSVSDSTTLTSEVTNGLTDGVKPSEVKPSEVKPSEVKPSEVKPVESLPVINPTIPTVVNPIVNIDSAKTTYELVNAYNFAIHPVTVNAELAKTYTEELVNNNDEIRRKALEKLMGISLTEFDYWGNSTQGTPSETGVYSTIADLKKDAFYAVNENRQALIQYGSKTDNWQPYRWYDALRSPSHYELVNGEVVHNKNFYASQADGVLNSIRIDIVEAQKRGDADTVTRLTEIYDRQAKYYASKFNEAPGLAVYSVVLHHFLKDRTDLNVTPVDSTYWNSKWNNPEVSQGKSIDGTNPFKTIITALKDGSLTGSLTEGYSTTVKTENTVEKVDSKGTTKGTKKQASTVVEETTEEEKPNLFSRLVLKVKDVVGF